MVNKHTSIISSRAQKEMAKSWSWYEERQKGLGDRFAKEVMKIIFAIEENPERHHVRFKTYREAMIDIFPFVVIYRIPTTSNIIRIVAVFHTSRNPKKKY